MVGRRRSSERWLARRGLSRTVDSRPAWRAAAARRCWNPSTPLIALGVLSLCACETRAAASPTPPAVSARESAAPSASSSGATTAASSHRDVPVPPSSVASAGAPSPAPPNPPPVTPPGPTLEIVFEAPYKLEERVEPKTKDAWWAEFREHRMWNKGGTGELLAAAPGPEGHPDPRVIVNIERAQGPHEPAALQRTARKYHWMNVVRCYRLGAYKDPELRGWTRAHMVVSSAGSVLRPKRLSTELEDEEVAACVVDKLRNLKFARASGATQAWVDIRVGPGDDPMPPPDELLVPGDGELDVEAMREGVERGRPAFEACFRAALDYAPGLWGRLVIRFHVTEKGVLDEAYETASSFPDARVQQCVLRAARKLKFPRPKNGDIRFLAPIRFKTSASVLGDPHKKVEPPG